MGARLKILEIAGSGTAGTCAAGPVTSVVVHVANGFARAGHEVVVLDSPCPQARLLLDRSIVVHESSTFARNPSMCEIRDLIGAHGFDAIHVHEAQHATRIGRSFATPVLWTAHGLNWTMERWVSPSPRALLDRWRERAAGRAAARVVVLNQTSRRVFGRRNVEFIPNGIDLSAWPEMDRCEARRRLGICSDEFRITYVGRIAPEKGVHVFTEAVRRARREVPVVADAIGSFSGRFSTSDTITPYATFVTANADDVQFHGFIHRDSAEYRLRLAAADAIVMPSITEPFGFVALEALACGAWLIGSDVGGIRDVLAPGTGTLVPPGDAQVLAQAIVARYGASTDPIASRQRAAAFSWDEIVARHITLVRDMTMTV